MPGTSHDSVVRALEHVAQFGVPPVGAARLLDVGTARYLKFFRTEILDDLVAHGAGTLRFFDGPYGSGKTHLLDLLAEDALDAGYAVARIDLSAASGLSNWHLLTQRILADLELRTPAASARSLPRILELLGAIRPGSLAEQPSRTRLPHAGFARAIELRIDGRVSQVGSELLRQFLIGERVSVRDLQAAGLPGVKHSLTTRNAEYVLRTTLSGLRRAGAQGTLLVFDESEKTFQRASVKVKTGANLLRRFVDAAAAGTLESCAAVFAVLTGFVEAAAEVYPALGQRVFPVPGHPVPSWRSPMLSVAHVTAAADAGAFLRGLVERLAALAGDLGVRPGDLEMRLLDTGNGLLRTNAGAGVRRDLCKALCGIALRHIENGRARP